MPALRTATEKFHLSKDSSTAIEFTPLPQPPTNPLAAESCGRVLHALTVFGQVVSP